MQNLTIEQAVIGIAIRGRKSLETLINAGLKIDDFSTKYQPVFQAITNLLGSHEDFDISHVGIQFPQLMMELVEISEKAPLKVNENYYVSELQLQKSILKAKTKLSRALREISRREPFGDIQAIVDDIRAVNSHFEKRAKNADRLPKTAKESCLNIMDELEKAQEGKVIKGYQTGWAAFDALTGGFRKGSYYVFAARPKIGKTNLWLSLLKKPILSGVRVLAFSVEMDGEQLIERLASSLSKVKPQTVRDGKCNSKELDRYMEALRKLYETNITICGKNFINFQKVEDEMKDRIKKGECDIVVLDYIQRYFIDRSRNKTQDTAEITNKIQDICKTYNVPIIVLAQLNRLFERDKESGGMAYIKDCGGIEQDADVIGILTRDNKDDGLLDIEGNRFGPELSIPLNCNLEFCSFSEKIKVKG